MKQLLGPDICEAILFIHGIMGCDTTSRLYGLGKVTALKLITKNSKFPELA